MHDIILQALSLLPNNIEQYLLNASIALVVVIVLYTVGTRVIQFLITRAVSHSLRTSTKTDIKKRSQTLASLAANTWRLIIIIGSILYIISVIFSNDVVASIFTGAGFMGVALAFGAQSLVKDFISGLFIISENQYRVGDFVEIQGFSGKVERITTRTTIIRDVDGDVHYFPNGSIAHVVNKSMDYSNARLTLSVAPDTEIDDVIKVVNKVGKQLARAKQWKDKIIEAPSYVMTGGISATAIDVVISGKVQPASQWSVTSEMRMRILDAFEEAGIELSATTSGGAATVVAADIKKKK